MPLNSKDGRHGGGDGDGNFFVAPLLEFIVPVFALVFEGQAGRVVGAGIFALGVETVSFGCVDGVGDIW